MTLLPGGHDGSSSGELMLWTLRSVTNRHLHTTAVALDTFSNRFAASTQRVHYVTPRLPEARLSARLRWSTRRVRAVGVDRGSAAAGPPSARTVTAAPISGTSA